MQQAAHAARMIGRSLEQQPRRPFRYKDLGNMATIGRNAAIADLGWMRIAGFPAWLLWLFIHIVWLIGFRNRLTGAGAVGGRVPDLSAVRAADHGDGREPGLGRTGR